MKRIIWAIVALAVTPVFCQTNDQISAAPPSAPPRVLTASERISFNIPMFGSIGRISCDAAGDMIFDVGSVFDNKGPFLRVQSDGRSHVQYSLPSETRGWGNIAWAVTPAGTFYTLFEDFKEYKLLRFRDDGSVGALSKLGVPPGVDVQFLAVANDETIFVRGNRSSDAPNDRPRSGFAALFDSGGRMIRDLSSETPAFDMKAAQYGPADGDLIAAEDGLFYMLGDRRILVLDKSGQVARELKFYKPSPEAHAVQADYSKGVVSILFHTLRAASPGHFGEVEVQVVLLNAQTGDEQGSYVFDRRTGGSVLCFDAQDGYSLMAVDGQMAAKDLVPLR